MMWNGPELRFTRTEDPTVRALRLAREIEELLEKVGSTARGAADPLAPSVRMARAVASSLVDELEHITAGDPKSVGTVRSA